MDGSITFTTELDNAELEKSLKKTKTQIESLQKKLGQKTAERDVIAEDMERASEAAIGARQRVQELQAELERLQSANVSDPLAYLTAREQMPGIQEELKAAQAEADRLATASDKIGQKYQKAAQDVRVLEAQIDSATGSAQDMSDRLAETEGATDGTAERTGWLADRWEDVKQKIEESRGKTQGLGDGVEKLGRRIKTMVQKVFVFSVILKGLRQVKEYLTEIGKKDIGVTGSFSRLGASLKVAIQPLVELLMPALTKAAALLTKISVLIGMVFSKLAGKNYQQMLSNAKALNSEAEAVEGVGDAAKEASRYLAGFDELNVMSDPSDPSAGGSSVATPDPGAAFDSIITPEIDLSAFDKLAEKIVKIIGIINPLDNIFKMWDGEITFEDLVGSLEGIALTAGIIALAFGPATAGLFLMVSGVALLITGFQDLMENGVSLQNVFTMIAGLLIGGLGISMMTGSWIPMLIAGILSILVGVLAVTGHLQQFLTYIGDLFSGLSTFITGLIEGDTDKILEGLEEMGKAVLNIFFTIAESILDILGGLVNILLDSIEAWLNTLVAGINLLGDALSRVSFDVPDWVPVIGGKTISFGWHINEISLPRIPKAHLPRLAQGAVIPANREFAAILGDQTHGRNLEAPEDLIRQIVREEAGNRGASSELMQILAQMLGLMQDGQQIYVDGLQLGRVTSARIGDLERMGGTR